eukprot:9139760-Heterocapsa_arctica.AAC.1
MNDALVAVWTEHEKKNEFGAHHLGYGRPWLYGNEGQEGHTRAPCDWVNWPREHDASNLSRMAARDR